MVILMKDHVKVERLPDPFFVRERFPPKSVIPAPDQSRGQAPAGILGFARTG